MKTLKIAIVLSTLLIPLTQAHAGDALRAKLVQARQNLHQDLQLIEQESRLFQAAAQRTQPVIQDETPEGVVVSLADLSLPGKVATGVLVKSVTPQNAPQGQAFSCVISVDFPPFFSAPVPASK